jgi:hypothetical protein
MVLKGKGKKAKKGGRGRLGVAVAFDSRCLPETCLDHASRRPRFPTQSGLVGLGLGPS